MNVCPEVFKWPKKVGGSQFYKMLKTYKKLPKIQKSLPKWRNWDIYSHTDGNSINSEAGDRSLHLLQVGTRLQCPIL